MPRIAERILAKRPDALALYAALAPSPGLRVVAADAGGAAEMFLYDEIGFWGVTAKAVVQALASAGDGPLTVRVNSPGGDVFDGMAIYNALRQRGGVTVQVDGVAASAAAFVAMAADKVVMAEAAMMMLHKCWAMVVGNSDDLVEQAALMEKIDGQQVDMFAGKTGMDTDAIRAVLAAETWYTSSEAVEAKLADAIMAPPKPEKKKAISDLALAALAARIRAAEMAD